MNVSSVLEFEVIRSRVASYCMSEAGAQRIMHAGFTTSAQELEPRLERTGIMVHLLSTGAGVPVTVAPDIAPDLNEVRVEGARLDVGRIASILRTLTLAQEFNRWFDGRVPGISVPTELSGELAKYVTPDGEIREQAIPELSRIRQNLAESFRRIQQKSQQIIRSSRRMFRDGGATVRDGRAVLPLVADFRGRIDGIVHELSDSGNTIFVEPSELVHMNNDHVALENEFRMVINALIRRLSANIRNSVDELEVLHEELARIDGEYARARYSYATKGIRPAISGAIHLVGARHPLLGASCIPVDIVFSEETRLLVVSGPNTGGKTVLLKTLGLLAAMHQFGLYIPADEGSSIPVFDQIVADIGDAQSIEASLSTFSAHLKNLAAIISVAGPRSLVLLDELGAGTDPDEAAALATAYVDALLGRDAFVLITTHLTVLKHFGYTHPRAGNAAMEFDDTRHRPTFRVIRGVPGSSHAIETAESVGLPPEIIDRAKLYLSDHSSDVATIIGRLTREEQSRTQLAVELEKQRISLATEREELERVGRDLREREAAMRLNGLSEIRDTLQKSRKDVEAAIRELRENARTRKIGEIEKNARESVKELEDLASTEQRAVDDVRESLRAENLKELSAGQIVEGMEVLHRLTGRSGIVKSNRGTHVEVQFGAIRMTVPVAEIGVPDRPASFREANARRTSVVEIDTRTSSSPATMELDLRGMRLAPALVQLEKNIDTALLSGIREFSVIHGTGTGVLQKGVADALSVHPSVERFNFAPPEQGGFGCTWVYLRDS